MKYSARKTKPVPVKNLPLEGNRTPVSTTTPRRLKFVAEYLKDLNGVRAALVAGYSPNGVQSVLGRLMACPEINYLIEQGKANAIRKAGVSRDRILEELAKIAFSNIQDCFDENSHMKAIQDMSPEMVSAIDSIDTEIGFRGEVTKKIKLHSKLKALDLLGKYLGLWKMKVEHEGSIEVNVKTGIDKLKVLGKDRLRDLHNILSQISNN